MKENQPSRDISTLISLLQTIKSYLKLVNEWVMADKVIHHKKSPLSAGFVH